MGSFGVYQYQLKKRYRSRFEKIINETTEKEGNRTEANKEKEIKAIVAKIKDIGISEELVNQILEKLDDIEKRKGYLESYITVQILSMTFETNTKYISKIVNVFKGKTFTQYINDLRVEYAVV